MLIFALVIAAIAVAIYAHRNKHKRLCRWRQSKDGSKGALIKYNCITCGAEVYRSTGQPDRCMANFKTPHL